jgi:signal transduction histidine kinase
MSRELTILSLAETAKSFCRKVVSVGVIRPKTIRARLFQILIVALGIVVAILTAVWRFSVVPALQLGVARGQQETARRAADQIEHFVNNRVQGLVTASQVSRFWEMDKEAQKEGLYRLLYLDPNIQEIGLVDRVGKEILRYSRTRVYNDEDLGSLAQDENFQKAMKEGTHIGQVYYGRTAEPFITVAAAVKLPGRKTSGVVIAEVTLKALWDAISHIKIGTSGHAFVVDQKGNLIAYPEYLKVLLLTNVSHLQEVKKFLSHPSQDPDFGEEVVGESGQKAISTFATVKGLNWAVLVEEPIEAALAETKTVERFGILILLVVTGAAFLISYFFSERIARPMRELEQRARLIAQGDLAQKLDIHASDEIESLADQFNRMAGALRESYQGLEEKIAERARDLSALYTALAPFASSDAGQVLQKVVERLKEATHADAVLIRVFDKETKSFHYPAHVGFPSSYLEATRDPEPGSAIGTAFTTGEPIIVADITQDPRLRRKRQLEAGFRSCVYLPLRVSEEFRGIVHLASRQIGHFSAEKGAHLMAIGRQMAIAMENRELFQDAERRAKEQEALNVIASATSQSLHLDETLQVALDKVLEVTGRERASIRLKDAVTGQVRLAAHKGFSPEEIETLLRRSQHKASEQVFASGQPLVINDPEELHGSQPLLQRSRFVAWIPIKAGTSVVGVLGVSAGRPIPFESREVDLLQAIGNVIGVALENARLFEETQRRSRELQALYTVTSVLNRSLDVAPLMRSALMTTLEVLNLDAGRLYVFDEKHDALYLTVHQGLPVEHISGMERYAPGEGVIGRIFVENRPLAFADMATDPNYAALARGRMGRSWGFRSAAGIPITIRESPVGVIYVYGRTIREFTSQDVELLSAIGGQIGFAIENARLFQELSKKAEELTRSNAELQRFAYIASHDLQEPLRMVSSYTQLLARRYAGRLDADADEFIRYAVDGVKRMQGLISDVLTYSRLGTREDNFERTDCSAVLSHVMANLKLAVEESGAVVTYDSLPTVMADRSQLVQLFQNLIGNGLKFRDHRPPIIHISARKAEKEWIFSIQDNGIGIDPQYAERIFVIFQRLHRKGEYPGTGIGLAICKKIVERHGGRIWVESELGEGATFYFAIPD